MTNSPSADPAAYDPAAVKHELQAIQALQPKLALYSDREFRELPKQLQQQIHALKTITQPTPSGLEHVESLLWQLAATESLLKSLANGESIANQLASLQKPVSEWAFRITPEPNQVQERVVSERTTTRTQTTVTSPPAANQPSGATLTLEPESATPTAPVATPSTQGGTIILTNEPATADDPQPPASTGTLVLPDEISE